MPRRNRILEGILANGRAATSPGPAEDEYPGGPEPSPLELGLPPPPLAERGDAAEPDAGPPQEYYAWQQPREGGQQTPARSFTFEVLDSAAFAAADYRPTWLIKRLLVAGQPAVIGGPQKSLKTSVAIDLAISLAASSPFLGAFDVYRPVQVAVLSGESGAFAIRETALRICAARGLDLAALPVLWGFKLPQLANPADLAELEDGLKRSAAEVVVIDPLYLSLLSGQTELQASNLYQMGPLLLGVAQACLDAGATPVLVHHTKRPAGVSREPLELADLAYSGVSEFAAQWLLISRREPFDPEAGLSRLWLASGGRCGQGGLWALDVAEGTLGEDFQGRRWDVEVRTAAEEREGRTDTSRRQRQDRQLQQEREEDARFLVALDRLDPGGKGVSLTAVRNEAGMSGELANRTLARLAREGIIEEMKGLETTIGNGAKRKVQGVRRRGGKDD